jgi:hypothetical protein
MLNLIIIFMINFWNKIKLFAVGLVVMLFSMSIVLNSCDSKKSASDSDGKEKTEHPTGDSHEHPSDQEHPSNEEHPTDSVKSGSDEHPAGGGGEHPAN